MVEVVIVDLNLVLCQNLLLGYLFLAVIANEGVLLYNLLSSSLLALRPLLLCTNLLLVKNLCVPHEGYKIGAGLLSPMIMKVVFYTKLRFVEWIHFSLMKNGCLLEFVVCLVMWPC